MRAWPRPRVNHQDLFGIRMDMEFGHVTPPGRDHHVVDELGRLQASPFLRRLGFIEPSYRGRQLCAVAPAAIALSNLKLDHAMGVVEKQALNPVVRLSFPIGQRHSFVLAGSRLCPGYT